MDRKKPVAVIAVVSDALALRYTHAQIDQFMESAGIELSPSPPGNRQVKTRARLRHANETMPDPLGTLGKVITETMEVMSPFEADPQRTSESQDQHNACRLQPRLPQGRIDPDSRRNGGRQDVAGYYPCS